LRGDVAEERKPGTLPNEIIPFANGKSHYIEPDVAQGCLSSEATSLTTCLKTPRQPANGQTRATTLRVQLKVMSPPKSFSFSFSFSFLFILSLSPRPFLTKEKEKEKE
jgi:hypothetical protein